MGALTKNKIVTVLVPAVPPVPAAPDIPFHLFATPPPLGYEYTTFNGYHPDNAAEFFEWTQLGASPVTYTPVSTLAGTTFLSLESLIGQDIPPNASPLYGGIPRVLLGYLVSVFAIDQVPNPPTWKRETSFMSYALFLDAIAANEVHHETGYPTGPGPYVGTYDLPTNDGTGAYHTVSRVYEKDARGVWMPALNYVDPPYCVTAGACKVMMLSNFPGAPAKPAVPAVTSTDFLSGWNSGADSAAAIDGDVHVVFQVAIIAGGAVGFNSARIDVTQFGQIEFAFYFDNSPTAGTPQFTLLEHGVVVSPPQAYATSDTFEIRREGVAGIVTYKKGSTVLRVSPKQVYGPLVVTASLYRGGDKVL